MKRRQPGLRITIGDIVGDLRDLQKNQSPTPHSPQQGDWEKFCRAYKVAKQNHRRFVPMGNIPGPVVLIDEKGEVVAATDPKIPRGKPTPEVRQAVEGWENLRNGLGYELTPWEEGAVSKLLSEGKIPSTLVIGILTLEWQGERVPLGVALRGHPEDGEMEVVAVYNPANLNIPSVGTRITVDDIQFGGEDPLAKLLRVWAKVETKVLEHTSLRPSSHQQTQPHLSQEQAQSHRPTKPNQRYRRRKR
jgi:hypothetical protein